jgi:hypothetical protein
VLVLRDGIISPVWRSTCLRCRRAIRKGIARVHSRVEFTIDMGVKPRGNNEALKNSSSVNLRALCGQKITLTSHRYPPPRQFPAHPCASQF